MSQPVSNLIGSQPGKVMHLQVVDKEKSPACEECARRQPLCEVMCTVQPVEGVPDLGTHFW